MTIEALRCLHLLRRRRVAFGTQWVFIDLVHHIRTPNPQVVLTLSAP